jgi:chemotaxis protein histidine kinase CheA
VYNERGHRAEEDEPDTYPEDDVSSQNTPRSERLRSEPSSRARTPTDPYYSERESSIRRGRDTPVSLSSAIPEIVRASSSKGPSAPSPSVHSRAAHSVKGSDGDRTGSESDRKRALDKGKERERDRDQDRTPVSRAASRSNSIKPGGVEGYANGHGLSRPVTPGTATAPATASSMSRASSQRGKDRAAEASPIEQDPPSNWEAPPRSATGDQPRSPSLFAPLDSTPAADSTSIFGDRPKSPWGAPPPAEELPPAGSMSLTPSGEGHKSIFGTPRSAFGDTSKSMFGTPKSAFGDNASRSIFGDDAGAPKSIFDESAFGQTSTVVAPALFEENPAALAGEQPSSSFWDDPASAAAAIDNGNAAAAGFDTDMWRASPAVVESPPIVESPTTKGKKKKSSAAASRNSPATLASKSPFAQASEPLVVDPPAPAAADIAASLASALLGSGPKAAGSPRLLSPLNPAAQEVAAETYAQDSWGLGGGTTASPRVSTPAVATTPVAATTPAVEEAPLTPGDETVKEAGGIGKSRKKKKGSAATTPAATTPAATTPSARLSALEAEEKEKERVEEERKMKEKEKEEAGERARKEKEAADKAEEARKRKEKEAADKAEEARKRKEREAADKAEEARKRKEAEAARKKEKEDAAAAAEAARIEQEKADAAAAAEVARIEEEYAAAEAARIEKERADAAEAERKRKERADAAEAGRKRKEAEDAAEAARIAKEAEEAAAAARQEQEERDKADAEAKAAAELFNFDTDAGTAPPPAFGGGDGLFSGSSSTPAWKDSDLGWGTTTAPKKGKKSKGNTPAATTPAATTPSKLSSFSWGGAFGSSSVFPDTSANDANTNFDAVYDNVDPNSGSFGVFPDTSANDADMNFEPVFDNVDFNSGSFGNDLGASLGTIGEGTQETGQTNPANGSGVATPIPPPAAFNYETPAAEENADANGDLEEVTSPTGEGDGGIEGEGAPGQEAQEEDSWGGFPVTSKKKKNKKGKNNQEPAAEDKIEGETTTTKEAETGGAGKGKKKKGKKG